MQDLSQDLDLIRRKGAVRISRISCLQRHLILIEAGPLDRHFIVVQKKDADILIIEIILFADIDDVPFPDPEIDH